MKHIEALETQFTNPFFMGIGSCGRMRLIWGWGLIRQREKGRERERERGRRMLLKLLRVGTGGQEGYLSVDGRLGEHSH